jgi:hypothetical protein
MKVLSKILVAIAVLSALGYSFHRFQSCQIVGASPGYKAVLTRPETAEAVPSNKIEQILIYPSHEALTSMKLDYEVAHTNSNGSIMALPLPPMAALQTTLMLSPNGHHNLLVAGANNKCEAGIDVSIYRLDQDNPVFTGSISSTTKRAPLLIDFKNSKLSNPFIMTIKLEQGAKNNWFCNVVLSWDGAK